MATRRSQQTGRRKGALHVPDAVVQAIASVVSYCWRDESADFQGRTPEERNGHVFRDLVVIRRWLNRNDVQTKN